MNLAQCIPPEWAQALPREGFAFRPAELRVLRVITHTSDGLQTVEDPDSRAAAERAELERQIIAAQVERRPAAAPPPVAKAKPADWRRVSASNPWPHGKAGARFDVLTRMGVDPARRFDLATLHEATDLKTRQQVSQVMEILIAQGLAQRSGQRVNVRFQITAAGLAALKVG